MWTQVKTIFPMNTDANMMTSCPHLPRRAVWWILSQKDNRSVISKASFYSESSWFLRWFKWEVTEVSGEHHSPCQSVISLLFPQVDIQDRADQEEGDTQPGHDETVAKVSLAQIPRVVQDLLSVEGEDEARGEGCETCKGLTEACEVEESSSGHGEQLAHKSQEGDGGEDHCKDHEGLNGLQPVALIGGRTHPRLRFIIMEAVKPKV